VVFNCLDLGGMQNGVSTLENSLFLKMLNVNLLYNLAIFPPPRTLPKRNENISSHKSVFMNTHTNGIHNISKGEKFQCQPISEWINEMWYVHIVGYNSAIKKVLNVNTWYNRVTFKSSMLSKKARCLNVMLHGSIMNYPGKAALQRLKGD
jgi:hypothetical protein